MPFSKTIGIVGGAGPAASAFLYASIVRVCQDQYGANDYNEFPEMILVSYPFTRGNETKIREEISFCLSKLKTAGATLFCIASHSFHGFLPELPETGFVNLVTEGLKEASFLHISKALILAAPVTLSLKLYERSDIECVYPSPEKQQTINQIIRKIAGGTVDETEAHQLRKIIASMHETSSFDGVILACTELPLLHSKLQLADNIPVVDTIKVLSKKLVAEARA